MEDFVLWGMLFSFATLLFIICYKNGGFSPEYYSTKRRYVDERILEYYTLHEDNVAYYMTKRYKTVKGNYSKHFWLLRTYCRENNLPFYYTKRVH